MIEEETYHIWSSNSNWNFLSQSWEYAEVRLYEDVEHYPEFNVDPCPRVINPCAIESITSVQYYSTGNYRSLAEAKQNGAVSTAEDCQGYTAICDMFSNVCAVLDRIMCGSHRDDIRINVVIQGTHGEHQTEFYVGDYQEVIDKYCQLKDS
jgi:hypothetical protein